MKKMLLITIGFISISLGAIGVFLPIFPTTPFVLIAAACFSASSPKLYTKLKNTKYFGEFIENYNNKTGVTKAVKMRAIAFLFVTLVISALIFQKPLVIGILSIVGIAVTIHILTIKNKIIVKSPELQLK